MTERPEDGERGADASVPSDSPERPVDVRSADGPDHDEDPDRSVADGVDRSADDEYVGGADRTTDDALADDAARDEDGGDPSLAGIFGARPEDAPARPSLEPESPSLEHAAFVVLGVLFGLFVVYRAMAVLPT